MMELQIANSLARRSVAIALAGFVMLTAGAVRAETESEAAARAQTLFDEARNLMKDGRYTEACPKLEESQRLDPGGGTLLNLGICHARVGLTATAVSEFRAALAQAQADGRADREKTAQRNIDDLTPLLSWLRVRVPSDLAALGLRVEIDGVELPSQDFGAELPIDPGVHAVNATAPDRKPWSTRVQIAVASDHQTLEIPALEPASSPKVVPPVTAAPPLVRREPEPFIRPNREGEGKPTQSDSTRFIGYASGGVGLAAIGVGAYFGMRAITLKKRSDESCPDGETCRDQRGVDDFNEAKRAATVTNICIGVGVVGIGAGTYFLFLRPTPAKSDPSLHVSFSATPRGGVAAASGRF